MRRWRAVALLGADRLVEGGGASAARARCFECLGLKRRPVGLCCGPWRRPAPPGSFTCPSSLATCCGTAALGATWCRTFCPPASCRPPSQVRPDPTPHVHPSGPGPATGSRPRPPVSSRAPPRVYPQHSGPPSGRRERWRCCSTSTPSTACSSEYRAMSWGPGLLGKLGAERLVHPGARLPP